MKISIWKALLRGEEFYKVHSLVHQSSNNLIGNDLLVTQPLYYKLENSWRFGLKKGKEGIRNRRKLFCCSGWDSGHDEMFENRRWSLKTEDAGSTRFVKRLKARRKRIFRVIRRRVEDGKWTEVSSREKWRKLIKSIAILKDMTDISDRKLW